MSSSDTVSPIFSVVIPARDEEKELPLCLDAIRASWCHFASCNPSLNGNLEIVVVLNRCTDKTEEIARAAGCLTVHNDQKNLAAIRNSGVRATQAQFVITIDADSRMSLGMFERVYKELSSGEVAGGGVLIIPSRFSLGIILTALMLVPIAVRYRISAGLLFFTRDAFEAIGGFNEALPSVEDIAFARSLRGWAVTQKLRFVNLLRVHIVTSTRKFDTFGDWYFLRHPLMTLRLLKGIDAIAADRVWYDFPRDRD